MRAELRRLRASVVVPHLGGWIEWRRGDTARTHRVRLDERIGMERFYAGIGEHADLRTAVQLALVALDEARENGWYCEEFPWLLEWWNSTYGPTVGPWGLR